MNNASFRFQLQQVDLALLALFQERARLCNRVGSTAEAVAMEDLLRRADGSVPAEVIRDVFEKLNQGSIS